MKPEIRQHLEQQVKAATEKEKQLWTEYKRVQAELEPAMKRLEKVRNAWSDEYRRALTFQHLLTIDPAEPDTAVDVPIRNGNPEPASV